MTIHFALLLGYLVVQVALGLWISRKVTTTGDFFVAGRSLGPGLLFSTLVAANIGAGSTVGAAGLAGPGKPVAAVRGLRPRLFLASPCQLRSCDSPLEEPRLLALEVQGQPAP